MTKLHLMQHTHQFKNLQIKKILPLFCASVYENICKLYESALMESPAHFQSTLSGSEISRYNATNILMNRLISSWHKPDLTCYKSVKPSLKLDYKHRVTFPSREPKLAAQHGLPMCSVHVYNSLTYKPKSSQSIVTTNYIINYRN